MNLLGGGHRGLRRWGPLAGAVLLTVLLAAGVAATADQLVAPHAQPAPQLKTVSTATLARLGLSLAATSQPPYCALTDQGVRRGWLHPGAAGCPISRAAAESLARRGGRSRVIESLLALVTSRRPSLVGQDQLAWLVVTQFSGGSPAVAGTGGMGAPVVIGMARLPFSQLVLINGHTGAMIGTLPLSMGGGAGRVPRTYPPQPGLATAAG